MVLTQEAALGVSPGFAAQHVAAVPAGIDKCAKPLVLAAHDDVGLVEDLVLLPIAGLGQLIDPTDHLPDFLPDRIAFLGNEFRSDVAPGRNLHPVRVGSDVVQGGGVLDPISGACCRHGAASSIEMWAVRCLL